MRSLRSYTGKGASQGIGVQIKPKCQEQRCNRKRNLTKGLHRITASYIYCSGGAYIRLTQLGLRQLTCPSHLYSHFNVSSVLGPAYSSLCAGSSSFLTLCLVQLIPHSVLGPAHSSLCAWSSSFLTLCLVQLIPHSVLGPAHSSLCAWSSSFLTLCLVQLIPHSMLSPAHLLTHLPAHLLAHLPAHLPAHLRAHLPRQCSVLFPSTSAFTALSFSCAMDFSCEGLTCTSGILRIHLLNQLLDVGLQLDISA